MTLWLHECKSNRKNLLIWSLSVGVLCFGCLLMYNSLETSMSEMSEMFSQMGSFSAALGMNKVSIGTLEGYYAIEIAIILSLGGAMYAAMTGAAMVAKEEEGHTSEFLNTMPIGRISVILEKYGAMTALILLFQVIVIGFVVLGFVCMGSRPSPEPFCRFHAASFLMQLEIGSISFLFSAAMKKKPIGAALGLTIFLYLTDLMCRVVPALEKAKYITPFYFSNGADIFAEGAWDVKLLGISLIITVLCGGGAVLWYRHRDLAA